MFLIFVLNLVVMILELTASQLTSAHCAYFVSIKAIPSVREGEGRGGGRSVPHGLSTELFLLMTISIVLCPSGLTQTKQWYLAVPYLCCHLCCLPSFIHCADVPGGDLGGCLGCQKGGRPCSFHQAFTAMHHTPSGWMPFHTQVWFSRLCCRCFCNRLGFSGQELLAISQPLSLKERWSKFVWPLNFDFSNMGGPARSLCSSWQSSQGHWDTQATNTMARNGPCSGYEWHNNMELKKQLCSSGLSAIRLAWQKL